MRAAARAIALLAIAALLATACATIPSSDRSGAAGDRQRVYQAYERQLVAAVTVYEETMIAAGAAAERGTITEAQLEQIAAVGRRVKAALEGARYALAAALQLEAGDPWPAIADAQAALLELARAAGKVTS